MAAPPAPSVCQLQLAIKTAFAERLRVEDLDTVQHSHSHFAVAADRSVNEPLTQQERVELAINVTRQALALGKLATPRPECVVVVAHDLAGTRPSRLGRAARRFSTSPASPN